MEIDENAVWIILDNLEVAEAYFKAEDELYTLVKGDCLNPVRLNTLVELYSAFNHKREVVICYEII